jgi:hypothetical protein
MENNHNRINETNKSNILPRLPISLELSNIQNMTKKLFINDTYNRSTDDIENILSSGYKYTYLNLKNVIANKNNIDLTQNNNNYIVIDQYKTSAEAKEVGQCQYMELLKNEFNLINKSYKLDYYVDTTRCMLKLR